MNIAASMRWGMACLAIAGSLHAEPMPQPDNSAPPVPVLSPEMQPSPPAVPAPVVQQPDPAPAESKPGVSEASRRKIHDTLRRLDDLLMRR